VSLPRVPTYAVSETPGKSSQGPAVQVGIVAVAVPPAALSNEIKRIRKSASKRIS
jgi:hypothetical protein